MSNIHGMIIAETENGTDMPKMPDSPNGWFTLLTSLPGPMQALIAGVITAVLRVIYDKSETRWQRVSLEGLMCGCISYGIASGAEYFQVPSGVAVFIGSTVGFIGVVKFREFAMKFIGKKVDSV